MKSVRLLQFLLTAILLAALTVQTAKAQGACETGVANVSDESCSTRVVSKQWNWGIGRANVLDTYLSPLEYTGPDFAIHHRTVRTTHWGQGHWLAVADFRMHLAYLKSPTDDGREWDTEISAAGGIMHKWKPTPAWQLAAGGMVETSGGGTYNTRNANNPAQGRLGVQLEAAAQAEWSFRMFRKRGALALGVDFPLLGAQFSPEYGQSYYEIFSLGHTGGIVHFTHPGNVPSFRLQMQARFPILGANLTVGYQADVRQSRLGGLKRHAWRNGFMLGFQRTLRVVR